MQSVHALRNIPTSNLVETHQYLRVVASSLLCVCYFCLLRLEGQRQRSGNLPEYQSRKILHPRGGAPVVLVLL